MPHHPVHLTYLQMAKPNYALIAEQIALTTPGSPERAALQAQLYSFTAPLLPSESQIFSYVYDNYVEATPGYKGGTYSSYVGQYYSDEGLTTQ
jgi:hypothetical protein